MSWLLLSTIGVPALAALAMARSRSDRAARVIGASTGITLVLAGVLAVLVTADAPATATLWASGDEVLAGFRADRITIVLLLLIVGVSWIVQRFAQRSLRGDARAARFAVLAGLLTTSAAATAAAATLIGLAIAWTATSAALCALIALYRGYEAAEEGVRRTATALAIGDTALWAAVVLLTIDHGSIDLAELAIAPFAVDGASGLLVAGLLLVAAGARSAQVPFQGWLPATLASPTPVSAMLHAGVVNAGAVLLLATAPIITQVPAVMYAAIVVGVVTALVGTALMLARPDIKGSLAQSTVAQMGFMIMTCGFGAWAAAVLHLAAHGTYKASRFLNSGTAVQAVQRHGVDHRGEQRVGSASALGVGLIAALPIGAAAWLLGASGTSALLLIFAWAALALAGRGWVAAQPLARGLATFVPFALLAGPLYVLIVEEFHHFVEPALPAAAGPLPSPLLLIPIAALIAAVALLWAYGPATLRARLYVWALTVGDGSRPPRSRRGTPVPTLVVDPERSLS